MGCVVVVVDMDMGITIALEVVGLVYCYHGAMVG
jgi:hypothetical protein